MSFVFVIFKTIKIIFDTFIKPLIILGFQIYYRNEDRCNPLPPNSNPYLFMPAHKLAEKIRNKEIKSVTLVEIFIERIKEIQPYLNCVVKTCFDEAIQQAKVVDKLLEEPKIPEKYSVSNAPLLGVPFSCKESIWVKGMPNSTGVIARKDFRAPDDADVVRYMREAGAILTCLTNTSEGCMWFESSNYLYGTTKNPYNLSRIVGGSSGGEGCIVSGTGSVMGIGSDIGGSIRMPAFFNGVYGHKATSNFISNNTQHPPASGIAADMLTTGPICRYASDLNLLFKIFSGPRYQEVAHGFESKTDFRKLKFYVIRDLQGNLLVSKLSSDASGALNKAVMFVEKSFDIKVEEIKLSKFKSSFQIWTSMVANGEISSNEFSKILGDSRIKINPILELFKSIIGLQRKHTLPALGLALTERAPNHKAKHFIEKGNQLKKELKDILGDNGVLLFPSFPIVAPYHNQPLFTNTLDYLHFGIINSLGFPSTQCPMGLNKDGLPTGIQIIANHNMDHLTIRLAEYFETNLTGWIKPF